MWLGDVASAFHAATLGQSHASERWVGPDCHRGSRKRYILDTVGLCTATWTLNFPY
ncbi:hypothetical protein BDU57DRAFT_510612 [Ampelomyces quisqualis]|uniref:Uncharacterized protein n=1 Tax=Ampelomyces quisqualis TaxID=50730 RepID=A0A6A5R209_AMPQU|nr:hypothetical protein BDU57DRAFT_510612 [Ampelomyces quisqualis]